MPFQTGKLEKYSKIDVPILGVIGDDDSDDWSKNSEWTACTIDEAIDLMRSENVNAQIVKLSDCDHDFTGKTAELSNIIELFVTSKL